MARTIRLHLDEHVAKAIAKALRQLGVDLTRTPEVGLRGASDDEHFQFAIKEGRCIVTDDRDFLRIDCNRITTFWRDLLPSNILFNWRCHSGLRIVVGDVRYW